MANGGPHGGDYTIDTDKSRFDLAVIHDYLSRSSYWAQGRRA